jgi:hypothetical protein
MRSNICVVGFGGSQDWLEEPVRAVERLDRSGVDAILVETPKLLAQGHASPSLFRTMEMRPREREGRVTSQRCIGEDGKQATTMARKPGLAEERSKSRHDTIK